MTLESQVTSLELSKRLKELGVRQESLFMWQCYPDGNGYIHLGRLSSFDEEITYVSAFTVAELGQLLWDAFEKVGWKKFFFAYGEVFGFKGTSFVGELGIVNFMRRPDMAAKMLIYLIENKLITL